MEIVGECETLDKLKVRIYEYLDGVHVETLHGPDYSTWENFTRGGYKAVLDQKFPEVW